MHFLQQDIPENTELPVLTGEVKNILESYSWPGNIRELENAVKHAVTFAQDNIIRPDALPARITANTEIQTITPQNATVTDNNSSVIKAIVPLKTFLKQQEIEYLKYILEHTGGNKEKAAAILEISLATLYRKLTE